MKKTTQKLTISAMLAALSILLVAFIHFPLFPAAPFLEYDPADVPIIIGTLLFGPWTGLLLTAVTCVIQGITVSALSGPIGIFMHFCATGALVIVTGLLRGSSPRMVRVGVSLVAGVVAMTGSMLLWNVIFTPIFMNTPREAVMEILLPVILPFNLIKAGVNAVLAAFLYWSLRPVWCRLPVLQATKSCPTPCISDKKPL